MEAVIPSQSGWLFNGSLKYGSIQVGNVISTLVHVCRIAGIAAYMTHGIYFIIRACFDSSDQFSIHIIMTASFEHPTIKKKELRVSRKIRHK